MGKVRSESIRLVKAAFTHAGIHPPRTVYHVVTSRDAEPPAEHAEDEPPHAANVDTTVNRDIDNELADALRATAAATVHMPKHDKAAPMRPRGSRLPWSCSVARKAGRLGKRVQV